MTNQFMPVMTIASGGTTSDFKDKNGYDVVGFFTPAALTSTSITFNGAADNDASFVPICDSSGDAVSFSVSAGRYYGFSNDQISKFRGPRYIELVTGSAEAAARQITLVIQPRSNF